MDFEIGVINVGAWHAEKEGKCQANFGTVAAHELQRMRVLDKMPLPDPVDTWKLSALRAESYKENDTSLWTRRNPSEPSVGLRADEAGAF